MTESRESEKRGPAKLKTGEFKTSKTRTKEFNRMMQEEAERCKARNSRMLILIIALGCGVFFLIYFLDGLAKHSKQDDVRVKIEQEITSMLAEYERISASEPKSVDGLPLPTSFQCAQQAAKILNRTDDLLERFPSATPRYEKTRQDYEAVLAKQAIIPPDQKRSVGKTFAPFVCPTARIEMVPIPGGSFQMGGTEDDELPVHEVKISPFWMACTEITNRQIRTLIPSIPPLEWNNLRLDSPERPAAKINWIQAMLYCKKLTELERQEKRIPAGYEYRLPTEAEWEYACRAGTKTAYYWGDSFGEEGAKYANSLDREAAARFQWQIGPLSDAAESDSFSGSAPVKSFLPNAWGLYDMSGNVAEWCYDWYDPRAYLLQSMREPDPVRRDPVNVVFTRFRPYDAGTYDVELACRTTRGGSWGMEPEKLRSAARHWLPPDEKDVGTGFRPVLAPVISDRNRN